MENLVLDDLEGDRVKVRYNLKPLSLVTIGAIVICSLMLLFRIVAALKLKQIPEAANDIGVAWNVQWWATTMDQVYVLFLVFFVLSIIPLMMWIYRAYYNLEMLKLRGLNVTAGWAVGWFFVPFANLFYVPVVINDILKGTKHVESGNDLKASVERVKITPWGGIWLILRILTTIFTYMGLYRFVNNPDITKLSTCINNEVISIALNILTGAIIVYVVASVTKKQNKFL